jgi:GDSL-like lipase/acylhydrolase family protein
LARLPLKRKRLFRSLTVLLLAASLWYGLEAWYRLAHSIPFTGGTLYEHDLKIPESVLAERPWYRTFLATFRASENPILFYEPRPGYRGRFYRAPGEEPGAEVAINPEGFRDRSFPLEKDPRTFRIVVLGDSIVWGHGLALEDTFAKQLERLLTETCEGHFEVLNFGVSGYSTRQEVELYRVKASRFHPDLLIVGYCLNDFGESSVEGEAFHRLYYDIFTHSYLYERLRKIALGLAHEQFGASFAAPEQELDVREQFGLLRSYSGRDHDAVVIFPELTDFDHYLPAYLHERVSEVLKGLGYEVMDLLFYFNAFEPEALQQDPHDHTHPNAFGTRVAAQATRDFLVRKRLVPAGAAESEPPAPGGAQHPLDAAGDRR